MTRRESSDAQRDEAWLDHLVRERRGSLEPEENGRLDSAVASSVGLRAALLAHQEFERRGAVQPGDDERCQRVLTGAEVELGWREPAAAVRRRNTAWRWAVPLGFFAAGAAAAAATGVPWFTANEPSNESQPTASLVAHPQAGAHSEAVTAKDLETVEANEPVVPALSPTDLPEITDPASAAALNPSATPRHATNTENSKASQPSTSRVSTSPITAKELFTLATEHKSSGEWGRASELYQRLVRNYPGSEYAAVAQMALGKRALQTGNAGAALNWFRKYQQQRPGSSMTSEAMWGEAQALKALGRSAESQRIRRELARRFPSSPYASRD